MHILYFARLRDQIGCADEEIALPDSVKTVGDLLIWLRQKSDGHALALGPGAMLKVAVNQTYANFETTLMDSDEVAFFPPVTGG